jgi:hypothetical protein
MAHLSKRISVLTLLLVTLLGAQAQEASYFRAWQGFKNPNVSQSQFEASLPSFMKMTVDLYGGAQILSQYIVVIPPAEKPSFIPDELALVALSTETDYRAIRQTPAGQAYGEAHWKLFNKENSKSADPITDLTAKPQILKHHQSYDVIGTPIDWSKGYNIVFIGIRKANLSPTQFLRRLTRHVYLTKRALTPKGLKGFLVIANENYEVAYLNWESQKAHDLAFQTSGGKAVSEDSAQFMESLMYQVAAPYDVSTKTPLQLGKAYSTR